MNFNKFHVLNLHLQGRAFIVLYLVDNESILRSYNTKHTFKVLFEEGDAHISWDTVEATRADHEHSRLASLLIVTNLHEVHKLEKEEPNNLNPIK